MEANVPEHSFVMPDILEARTALPLLSIYRPVRQQSSLIYPSFRNLGIGA